MANVELPTSPGKSLLTYKQVEQLLYTKAGKFILSRKVFNNTYLERCPNGVQLRLHRTGIITWHRDNTLTLQAGGWYTMTTKTRMNEWLPDHGDGRALWINQFNSYWHVGTAKADTDGYRWAAKENAPEGYVPFEEGMNFDMVTCTLVMGDNQTLADDMTYNAGIELLIKRWLDNWDKWKASYGYSFLGDVKDEQFEATLVLMLRDNQLPKGFFVRVAIDLGYHNPDAVALMWETSRKGSRGVAKAQLRKWLRAKLLHGARARGRAVRTREMER